MQVWISAAIKHALPTMKQAVILVAFTNNEILVPVVVSHAVHMMNLSAYWKLLA